MMRLGAVLVLGILGCGGSSKKAAEKPDPAEQARLKREAELEAMRPASPYEIRETRTYKPTERCGQGPWRFESDALKAKYGERLHVYACGKHAMKGNYRMTTTRKTSKPSTNEASFGFTAGNEACKGREAVLVAAGGSSGGGSGGKGAGPAGTGGPTSAAPAALEPRVLLPAEGLPKDCVHSSVVDMTWIASEDWVPHDGHVQVDVWSDEPSDLEGLVFVVEKWAVPTDMTLDRWKAYRAADKAYYEAYMANLDIDVKSGRTTLLDSKVTAPPPPPPRAEAKPPKPSVHARWIPGYWFYEKTQFYWIAGLWDVPDEDIQKELTVSAPTPPPAQPRIETPPEPAPTVTAVWTPGSWQWDGRAYIWVAGAWRIPPAPRSTWRAPTWNVRAGRSVYVPGGWSVGVRFGR